MHSGFSTICWKAMVTGSTSGIGRGIAEHFAALGSDVVVHGLDRADGLETVHRVRATGCSAEYFDGDLTSEEVCRALIRFAVGRYGSSAPFVRKKKKAAKKRKTAKRKKSRRARKSKRRR